MWEMAEQIGYTPATNLWENFTEREFNGLEAVDSFAEEVFNLYKDNIIYLTEFIMVINHKCWYWFEHGDNHIARFYSELYHEFDKRAINYIESNMDNEAMTYYFKTLD